MKFLWIMLGCMFGAVITQIIGFNTPNKQWHHELRWIEGAFTGAFLGVALGVLCMIFP